MIPSVPMQRGVLYIIVLGLCPLIILIFSFFSNLDEAEGLQLQFENFRDQIFIKEKKQALNLAVRQHFQDADHFYIDKYLETLDFLESEVETLQRIVKEKNFADDDRIKKRIEFLTGPGNKFDFSEGVVQTFPFFQETGETMTHPVEVNSSDIKKILARVEGLTIGPYQPSPNRPQLIITDFQIDKKKLNDDNEVYLLNMKLVKREFL